MLMTTTDTLPDAYTPLGIVSTAVPTGSVGNFEKGVERRLHEATEELQRQATALDADAIIGLKFSPYGMALLIVGTAVRRS